MIQLFGARPVVKKRPVPLGPQGSAMESGYGEAAAAGGGIGNSANQDLINKTQRGLSNPFTQLAGIFKKKKPAKPMY